jgi:hypothetical protein
LNKEPFASSSLSCVVVRFRLPWTPLPSPRRYIIHYDDYCLLSL